MIRALFPFLVLFVMAQGGGTPTVTLKQDGEKRTSRLAFPSKASIGAM